MLSQIILLQCGKMLKTGLAGLLVDHPLNCLKMEGFSPNLQINEFFVNKVRNLRNNLPVNNGDPLYLLRNLMQGRKCSFGLKTYHPDTVLKLISNLKSSSSCGLDTIDLEIRKVA